LNKRNTAVLSLGPLPSRRSCRTVVAQQRAIGGWRDAQDSAERARHVTLVGEARGESHLRERQCGRRGETTSHGDARAAAVFRRANAEKLAERAGEVDRVHTRLACQVRHAQRAMRTIGDSLSRSVNPARPSRLVNAVVRVRRLDHLREPVFDLEWIERLRRCSQLGVEPQQW